jgi:adenylate cyclase
MVNSQDTRKESPWQKIGRYLGVEQSSMTHALDRQAELSRQGIRKPVGEILFETGRIGRKELKVALRRQRLDRMRSLALFSAVDGRKLSRLCNLLEEVTVADGEEFIRQDTAGDCFYQIVSGSVLVFRRDEFGEEAPLETLDAGESIGEMGYFSDGKRSASVRARCETLLFKITYRNLQEAFKISPELAAHFLNVVTTRLRRTNIRFQETHKQSRIAETSLRNLCDFLDMSEIINLRLDIKDLIERVVLMAGKIMKADRATLFLVDPAAGELWSMVMEGETNRIIRIPIGSGIAGWVAQHGEILNIKDAYTDPRFNQDIDRRTGYTSRSILCGPVTNLQGEPLGVIQVINRKDGPFTEKDESLFRILAHQVAISVENFYLSRRMMAGYEKMSVLLDVVTSVSQSMDLSSIIARIVEKITQILHAERSSLFLLDKQTGELWSRVAQGLDFTEIRFPRDEGLAGHVMGTGEILNIRDAYQDARFNARIDQKSGFMTRTVLCMPLKNREGEIIGVTEVMNKQGGAFEQEDEDLLRALTAQIAFTLENAQLFERVAAMKNYLESVHESIASGILTLDDDYRIVTANRAALKLFRSTPEALREQDIRTVLGRDNARILGHIEKIYNSHCAVADQDVDLLLPGHASSSVNLNFVPLIGHKQGEQGLVLVFEDMTHEKLLKGTLLRYMAPDIVEKVLSDPGRPSLGGVRSRATILFADIRGFTAIAETMSAEQTMDLLNECFTVLVDILSKHSGVLDKYIGDAIMAVFGVPYAHPDDAVRAVRTAMAMREAIDRMNEVRRRAGHTPIEVGFGLATGDVISGNIGSEKRMNFTVIGDDVNISQYLEKQNKLYGTGILISESTKKEVGDAYVTRLIDRILFKGKKKPVNVYEVLGETGCPVHPAVMTFCEGLGLFHRRKFGDAGRLFARGAASDPPCRHYLERCRRFEADPPPADWDGVWMVQDD